MRLEAFWVPQRRVFRDDFHVSHLNAKHRGQYDRDFLDRLHGMRKVRNRLAHFNEGTYPTFAEFLQDVSLVRSFLSTAGADDALLARLDTLMREVMGGGRTEATVSPPVAAKDRVASVRRPSSVAGAEWSESVVMGVDGCPAGWLAVEQHLGTGEVNMRIYPSFDELLGATERVALIAIDVPIGSPDRGEPGGRRADKEARRLLSPRGSTVFSASGRNIFQVADFDEARSICANEGCPLPTKQSFAFLRKIKEVDALMTPSLQERIREIHPELCFLELNGGRVAASKKLPAGIEERIRLLERAGFAEVGQHLSRFPRSQAVPDDVLDAHAACWTSTARTGASHPGHG